MHTTSGRGDGRGACLSCLWEGVGALVIPPQLDGLVPAARGQSDPIRMKLEGEHLKGVEPHGHLPTATTHNTAAAHGSATAQTPTQKTSIHCPHPKSNSTRAVASIIMLVNKKSNAEGDTTTHSCCGMVAVQQHG